MNPFKRNFIWLAVLLVGLLTVTSVNAQTNNPPVFNPSKFPIGKEALWLAIIPIITFGITWVVGKIPPLPKGLLPLFTPLIGTGIGWVMNMAEKAEWAWWYSAGAGTIAVFLYESLQKLTHAGPESNLTPTPQTPPKP